MRQRRKAYECELCGRTGPGQLFILIYLDESERNAGVVCKRCAHGKDTVDLEERITQARSQQRLRGAGR